MKIRKTFVLCFDSRLCNTVIKSKWISLILVLLSQCERMKWFDYIVWMKVARPQTDVSSIRISGVWELTFHSPYLKPKKVNRAFSLRYVCRIADVKLRQRRLHRYVCGRTNISIMFAKQTLCLIVICTNWNCIEWEIPIFDCHSCTNSNARTHHKQFAKAANLVLRSWCDCIVVVCLRMRIKVSQCAVLITYDKVVGVKHLSEYKSEQSWKSTQLSINAF